MDGGPRSRRQAFRDRAPCVGTRRLMGRCQMPHYRVHIMNRLGDLVGVVDLDCPDDEAAKEQVEDLLDGYDGEIWRLVIEWLGPNRSAKH